MITEQLPHAPVLQPAAELDAVFSELQNPNLQPPQSVELFLAPETFLDKARRIGYVVMYGRDVSLERRGRRIDTTKPSRYDVSGYTENVVSALDDLITETCSFPDGLYDVAEAAVAVVNQEKRDYRYFRDNSQGVEAIGLLSAITSRPAFIKNPRAEEVLSQLGQASAHVCRGMFTDESGPLPRIRDGYDVASTQDLQRIATSKALWDKSRNRDIVWPLSATATALEALSVNHPIATQEARLAMLRKNEASGRPLGEVDIHLVYSFKTDEEKAFLEAAAAQDMHLGTGSRVAQKVVNGYYAGIRWAI